MDWPAEITKMVYWKQVIAENDRLCAFPWHLPGLAAEELTIRGAELEVGMRFPCGYRSFLRYADGWKGLLNATDLFSTSDFTMRRHELARERVGVENFLMSLSRLGAQPLVIGSNDLDLDIFIAVSDNCAESPGAVIWFANEEVERYKSFEEFFGSMVNYNADTAKELIEQAGATPG